MSNERQGTLIPDEKIREVIGVTSPLVVRVRGGQSDATGVEICKAVAEGRMVVAYVYGAEGAVTNAFMLTECSDFNYEFSSKRAVFVKPGQTGPSTWGHGSLVIEEDGTVTFG